MQTLRHRSVAQTVAGRMIALALLVGGCATYSDRTDAARDAVQRGDVAGGIGQLNRFLKVRKAEDLPSRWTKDYELVVLERATMLQAAGDYDLSARDFEVADKQLELLDIARDGAGKLGKYIYSDSATKYKTSPTEKLALNAMNLCNYLARGDLDGAKIEAKRFTVMRNYLRDYDPEHQHGAFGSYLAGFVYERLGQADEALRYYDEALQEREFSSLRGPIERLSQRGSYRGERIRDYLPQPPDGGAPAAAVPPAAGDAAAAPSDAAAPSAAPSAVAPTSDGPLGPLVGAVLDHEVVVAVAVDVGRRDAHDEVGVAEGEAAHRRLLAHGPAAVVDEQAELHRAAARRVGAERVGDREVDVTVALDVGVDDVERAARDLPRGREAPAAVALQHQRLAVATRDAVGIEIVVEVGPLEAVFAPAGRARHTAQQEPGVPR